MWFYIPWTFTTVSNVHNVRLQLRDTFLLVLQQNVWSVEKLLGYWCMWLQRQFDDLCPHMCPSCVHKQDLSHTPTCEFKGVWGPVIEVANSADLSRLVQRQAKFWFMYSVAFWLIFSAASSCWSTFAPLDKQLVFENPSVDSIYHFPCQFVCNHREFYPMNIIFFSQNNLSNNILKLWYKTLKHLAECRMVEWVTNNELRRVSKETVLTSSR
jgi:hypothetical protein